MHEAFESDFGIWSKNSLPSGFYLVVAVFDIFTRISIFVLFDNLVVCERVLKNWKRFDTNLVNKLSVYIFFGLVKKINS